MFKKIIIGISIPLLIGGLIASCKSSPNSVKQQPLNHVKEDKYEKKQQPVDEEKQTTQAIRGEAGKHDYEKEAEKAAKEFLQKWHRNNKFSPGRQTQFGWVYEDSPGQITGFDLVCTDEDLLNDQTLDIRWGKYLDHFSFTLAQKELNRLKNELGTDIGYIVLAEYNLIANDQHYHIIAVIATVRTKSGEWKESMTHNFPISDGGHI